MRAAILAAALFLASAPSHAAGAPPEPAGLQASSWILVDEDSGEVLASRDPRESLPIASAAKLMTAHLVLESLDPSDTIVAAPYRDTPGESLMGLEAGETVSVRDLLFGLLIASGNDAAVTLAIRVAGSTPSFVDRMNSAARRLGLDDTNYADPIGLDAGNRSSAADLVALASELRAKPLFRRIVDTPRRRVRLASGPEVLVNRNNLVREEPFVTGVKTGTTVEAGYVLVFSARAKGVDLVGAVLGAPGEAERDAAALRLLEYGAALYARRVVVAEGRRVGSLDLGAERGIVPLVADSELKATVRRGTEATIEFEPPAATDEAVARGQVVGSAAVLVDGERVGSVDVVAARGAPRKPEQGLSGLPGWAWGVFAGAALIAVGLGGAAIVVARGADR